MYQIVNSKRAFCDTFVLEEKIGDGGWGTVYKVQLLTSTTRTHLSQASKKLSLEPVAVKVMNLRMIEEYDQLGFVLNELVILKHAEHANLIKYVDSFIENSKLLVGSDYSPLY